MTIITPAGRQDFDWSPKHEQDSLTKTASVGSAVKIQTDKDILYEAAKKVVKAMAYGDTGMLEETAVAPEMGATPALGEGKPPCATCGDKPIAEEVELDIGGDGQVEGLGAHPEVEEIAAPAQGDAVKAVQELAEKAEAAEAVAGKVQEAVEKVEMAVQEVKDAVGGEIQEAIIDVDVEEEDDEKEEGEKKLPFGKKENKGEEKAEKKEEKSEKKEEKGEKKDDGEGKKEDEIVQESCMAAQAVAMKTASADSDDLVKTSKISATTRKKVTTLWDKYLGYDPEYVKLMVTDYEK